MDTGEVSIHIPTVRAVQSAVESLVRRAYFGWGEQDREDLVSLVLEKYVEKFGRGEGDVPTAWLRAVVRTTAIDLDDKRRRRPATPMDIEAAHDDGWALAGLVDLRTPSLITARGVAASQVLLAFAAQSPADHDLVRWRIIDELPLEEIAQRIGKSPEATKKAAQRALDRFRQFVAANPALAEALADRDMPPKSKGE
jgi:RNA polymerase sigma factor (sigma-70 family)